MSVVRSRNHIEIRLKDTMLVQKELVDSLVTDWDVF